MELRGQSERMKYSGLTLVFSPYTITNPGVFEGNFDHPFFEVNTTTGWSPYLKSSCSWSKNLWSAGFSIYGLRWSSSTFINSGMNGVKSFLSERYVDGAYSFSNIRIGALAHITRRWNNLEFIISFGVDRTAFESSGYKNLNISALTSGELYNGSPMNVERKVQVGNSNRRIIGIEGRYFINKKWFFGFSFLYSPIGKENKPTLMTIELVDAMRDVAAGPVYSQVDAFFEFASPIWNAGFEIGYRISTNRSTKKEQEVEE